MIEAFDLRTAHKHGDALAQQARLRYSVFVEKRQLPHTAHNNLEYDEFDTPGAVYVVWRDNDDKVRGLVRLLPTTLPYMLQTCWPHLAVNYLLPTSHDVWEVTRVCVDHAIDPKRRRRVLPELFSGVETFGSLVGIRAYLCVTRPGIIRHVLSSGVRQLGPVRKVEGALEAAFEVSQEEMLPSLYCGRNAGKRPILKTDIVTSEKDAA